MKYLNLLSLGLCSCSLWWFSERPPRATNFAVGDIPSSVAIGDLNEDGDPDVVVANKASGDVAVLLGRRNADFSKAHFFRVNGVAPVFVALGDIDSDTHLD